MVTATAMTLRAAFSGIVKYKTNEICGGYDSKV